MNRILKILSILILAMLLASCTTLEKRLNDFNPEKNSNIFSKGEKILFQQRIAYMPGRDGYNIFTNAGGVQRAVLLLSNKKLYVVKYSFKDNHYYPYASFHFSDITNIELRKFGLGRRLVIFTNKQLSRFSLDIFKPNESFIDTQATKDAFKIINQRIRDGQSLKSDSIDSTGSDSSKKNQLTDIKTVPKGSRYNAIKNQY